MTEENKLQNTDNEPKNNTLQAEKDMTENDNTQKTDGDEFKNESLKNNFETSINTDGREPYYWKSKYNSDARKEMRIEACYIGCILAISLIGLFCHWSGLVTYLIELIPFTKDTEYLVGIILYFLSGLLGGAIFGIKYFYRVVARGYWTQDRRYWRVFSPWISSCIALVVGCMVVSGYINANQNPSTAAGTCIGCIAGYFADEAVGKMSEVAIALFGSNGKTR